MADESTGSAWDYSTRVNYQAWQPGTEVELCNVQWDAQYRNIVHFTSGAARDAYLKRAAGPRMTLTKLTYHSVDTPLRLNIPLSEARKYNYVHVLNPAQSQSKARANDIRQNYYYFVQDFAYVSPHTTELYLMLDVWQTYGDQVRMDQSFVERSHFGMIPMEKDLTPHSFLTEPEGLDLGQEYIIWDTDYKPTATRARNDWGVIFFSSTSFVADPGSTASPNLRSAQGSEVEGIQSGAEVYAVPDMDDFRRFLECSSQYPWVTQGIMGAYMVPKWLIERAKSAHTTKPIHPKFRSSAPSTGGGTLGSALGGIVQGAVEGLTAALNDDQILLLWTTKDIAPRYSDASRELTVRPVGVTNAIPNRYKHMRKFCYAPYQMLQLTNYSGQELNIRPEMLADENRVKVNLLGHYTPPSPRIMAWVANIRQADDRTHENPHGTFLDYSMTLSEFPQIPIVNNGYINYMASTVNQRMQSNKAAQWAYNRALQGNSLAYNQSSQAMQMSQRNVGISNRAAMAHMELQNSFIGGQNAIASRTENSLNNIGRGSDGFNALARIIGGDFGGALGVGVGRIETELSRNVTNAARDESAALQQSTNRTGAMISAGAARDLNASQMRYSAYVRDTNKDYADSVALGDYQNTIAALQAQVQDARLTAPSISGQLGGESFLLATTGHGIVLRLLAPSSADIHRIGQYWARYGYSINRFLAPGAHLSCMTHFTYWKLKESNFFAAIPQRFLMAIRGIFENGVTVWRRPEDIGTIDYTVNRPSYRVEWSI